MASWMVHLRVADGLLDLWPQLSPTEFIVGNIAPDSGVPNEDWSVFTPSTHISHFKIPGPSAHKNIDIPAYCQRHFTRCQRNGYTEKQYSFYLGYLVHLLTDTHWSKQIVLPCLDSHPEEVAKGRTAFIWELKKDWYDLDFLYLQQHPDFRSFSIYKNAEGFENVYMDIFAPDAFDNRRAYITGFYSDPRENLDRVYPYLTKQEMDNFVEQTVQTIREELILLQRKY